MQVNNPLLNQVLLALESGKQVSALNLIDEILDFCIKNENGKVFGGWDLSIIRTLIAYNLAKDTISISYDGDLISGVMMWNHCSENNVLNCVMKWHPDKKNSNCIFVPFLVASSTHGFKELIKVFINKNKDYYSKKIIAPRLKGNDIQLITYKNIVFKKIFSLKEKV